MNNQITPVQPVSQNMTQQNVPQVPSMPQSSSQTIGNQSSGVQPTQTPVSTQQTAPVQTQSKVKTCVKCNKQFKVISQEVKFLNSKDLPLPDMCPTCRQERRMSHRNPRQLLRANCDKCGKEMITTPKANPAVKVYCDECFKEYLNTTDPIIK